MSMYLWRKHIQIHHVFRIRIHMLARDFAASITTTGSERAYSGAHFSTLGSDCTLLMKPQICSQGETSSIRVNETLRSFHQYEINLFEFLFKQLSKSDAGGVTFLVIFLEQTCNLEGQNSQSFCLSHIYSYSKYLISCNS